MTLDEATALVKNPATPPSVKAALAKAERVAMPAIELVKIAAVAHQRAATGATAAALAQALADAQSPATALATLMTK
ncbi:MAG: hypothetical protein WDN76_00765 [Alphaproteobacteria bacterium]